MTGFAPDWVPVAFGIISAAFVLASLGFELSRRPRPRLFLYYTLRMTALISLLLLLMLYFRSSFQTGEVSRELVFLEDVSGSMERMPPNARKELDAIKKALPQMLPPDVKWIGCPFAGRVVFSSEKDAVKDATALGDAVASVNRTYPSADMILLSDGASNTGLPPESAAASSGALGGRIHVLLPSEWNTPNRGTVFLLSPRPPVSWKKKLREFSIDVRSSMKSPECELFLNVDGKKSAERKFRMDSPFETVTIPLPEDFRPEEGWHEYEFVLRTRDVSGEMFERSMKGVFQVPSEQSVLLLWERNGPGIRALSDVLRERYGNYESYYEPEFRKLSFADQESLISESSLLLAGDLNPEVFSPEILRLLLRRITEKRLTLVLATPKYLEKWMKLPEFAPLLPVLPEVPTPLKKTLEYPFKNAKNETLLPLRSVVRLIPKRISDVLLSVGAVPLLIGNGQTAVFAFSDSWRWRLDRERAQAHAYDAFWPHALSLCDNFGRKGLTLTIKKKDSAAGDRIYEFLLHNYDAETPLLSARLLRLENDRGTPVQSFGKVPGTEDFAVSMEFGAPGIYWFRAEGETSKGSVLSPRVPVRIVSDELEELQYADGESVLRKMAALSGGSVHTQKTLSELGKRLTEKEKPRISRKSVREPSSVLHEFLLALLAMLCLNLEWLLRKLEENKNAG